MLISARFPPPITSTWPHLRCDVGLEEGEYRENCLCLAVLCSIIMMHKDIRAVLTGRSTVLGFDLACLALFRAPLCLRSSWCYIYMY